MIFSMSVLLYCLFHPIHVSVTEINYSEKDKSLQMISRIFVDDLELAIQDELKDTSLDLLKPTNGKTTDEIVSAYLLKHIKIKVDGKSQGMKWIGHEVDGLAIMCYIEIPNIKKLKTVEPMNDVIMATHHDQSNLVHVSYKGKLKSLRLVRDKPSDVLNFENN